MNAILFPLNIHCGCFLNKADQTVVSLFSVVCRVAVVPGRAFPLLSAGRQSSRALLRLCLHPLWVALCSQPFSHGFCFPGRRPDRTVCWREKQFQVLFPAWFLTLSHALPEGASVQQARRAQDSSPSIWVSCRKRKHWRGHARDALGHSWPKTGNIFLSLLPCLVAGKSQLTVKSRQKIQQNKSLQAESSDYFQPSLPPSLECLLMPYTVLKIVFLSC